MTRRIVHSARPTFDDVPAILADVERVLRSGRLMMGDFLERFELEFAAHVGTRHAVAVSSCTAALEATLRFIGVEGRTVIVPTNTFVATANAVLYAGGTPVLTDVNGSTLLIDADEIRRRIDSTTRAVIVVHLAGIIPPDIDEIRSLCEARGVALVEDCAHAHGSAFENRKAGTFGLAGCFSFYPTKVMTTGTGGMITTGDDTLASYVRSVRLHGRGTGTRGGLDEIVNLGNDWFLDEVGSVLGVHQLRALDRNLAHRRTMASRYRAALASVPSVAAVELDPRCASSYYKFLLKVGPPLDVDRFRRSLEAAGVEMESLYWPACHLQPVYRRLFGHHEGECPVAEAQLPRVCCLPIHAGVTSDDVDYVAECVRLEVDAQLGRSDALKAAHADRG